MQFPLNAHRSDPYRNFKFRVSFDGGRVMAGVSKVSAIKRTTEVVSHREGGDPSTPRNTPVITKFEPVTLERGVTFDPLFTEWANRVFDAADANVALINYKTSLTIELLDLRGSAVRGFLLANAWVSEYMAMPELDANGNSIAFETLVVQYEGFSPLPAVSEPDESAPV